MSSDSEYEDRKPAATEKVDANESSDFKKTKRNHAQDKKTSQKKKKALNHEHSWSEYCKFMNSNLEKKKLYHESPHIVVRKSLHLIIDNSIILNNPTISQDTSLQRKISYRIEKIGKKKKVCSLIC